MIGPIVHSAQQLHKALLRRPRLVFIDTETTGRGRRSRVLSINVRVEGVNYILFTENCCHAGIVPYITPTAEIQAVLSVLDKRTVCVFHHAKFDVPRLWLFGLPRNIRIIDTLQWLRLLDQDRLPLSEDKSRHRPRTDLVAPGGAKYLNYKLKDACAQLCGIRPLYLPARTMMHLPFEPHRRYLAHDGFCTEQLYEYLRERMPRSLRQWWRSVGVPLTHQLMKLTVTGIKADGEFIRSEAERLGTMIQAVSDAHLTHYGIALLGLDDWQIRQLVYQQYKLPKRWKKGEWPINDTTLGRLILAATSAKIRGSLKLIRGFRQLDSLRTRLMGYAKYIDPQTGRIHSNFDNRQSSGRVSSSEPCLQQLAKKKVIMAKTPFETTTITRNLLVASPGHIMVAADTEQSDPRVLSHEIAACAYGTEELVQELQRQRARQLDLARFKVILDQCRNPDFVGSFEPPEPFDPKAVHQLVEDFRNPKGDLYAQMASNMFGKTITKSDSMRDTVKTVFLAQLNGQTPTGLSRRLDCDVAKAKQHIARFFAVYRDVETFLSLLRWRVAITGETQTWAGRIRTITAHRWMVAEPRVRVLLTYANGDKFWYDVSPIRPSLRTLTCFVHRIWSVRDQNSPQLIYTDGRGRIGTRQYASVDNATLLYRLPCRNLPWRSIRQVRKLDSRARPIEEARYEGFDATARYAISTLMQGGTCDLTTDMQLRSRPLLRQFRARLLLQAHDELVAEVPADKADAFVKVWKVLLETAPAGFEVPVRMNMKAGPRFGDLQPI